MENHMSECKTNECKTSSQSCDTEKGSCETKQDDCCISEALKCLGKQSGMELLKDKIKKALEAKIGKKLDKIADVVSDEHINCLESKIAQKQAGNNYREELFAALTAK